MNEATSVWQEKVQQCLNAYDHIVSPRGMEVREVINGHYSVEMPAYLELSDRKVNLAFMFAEAAWIISGSNRVSDITPYMQRYSDFSDDGVFLKGAYGPKVVDQLPYVVETINSDCDTRQAVMTIWRERPGPSKDIPCTVAIQFLVRDNELDLVVTMRSQDIILGYTYDVFTFSMIAKAVQLLLNNGSKQEPVELGKLHVNAGSMHIYSNYYDRAAKWVEANDVDRKTGETVDQVLAGVSTYGALIKELNVAAYNAKKEK